MRLDFTLTLPGMFEVEAMQALAQEYDVDLLTKVIFSFSPDIILSPLALPRDLLEPWIDQLLDKSSLDSMRQLLLQLKQRPTFAEQWPDTYSSALAKGKQRVLKLESVRQDQLTLAHILQQDQKIYDWYQNIRADSN